METDLRRPRDGGLEKKAVGKSGLANTFAIIHIRMSSLAPLLLSEARS